MFARRVGGRTGTKSHIARRHTRARVRRYARGVGRRPVAQRHRRNGHARLARSHGRARREPAAAQPSPRRSRSSRARVSGSTRSPSRLGASSRCETAASSARNSAEPRFRTSWPLVPCTAASDVTRSTASRVAPLGGEPLEHRVGVGREAHARARRPRDPPRRRRRRRRRGRRARPRSSRARRRARPGARSGPRGRGSTRRTDRGRRLAYLYLQSRLRLRVGVEPRRARPRRRRSR